jgi:hypothetical protein
MRTLPRTVPRAFSETSGRILRMTVGVSGLALPVVDAELGVEGTGVSAGFEMGAEVVECAGSERAGEVLPVREFSAGAGGAEETLAGGGAVVGAFAAELDFADGEVTAFPDCDRGTAMVDGALEATTGCEDEGELLVGGLDPGETEFGEIGAAELPERER